jgi:hypothetical protein
MLISAGISSAVAHIQGGEHLAKQVPPSQMNDPVSRAVEVSQERCGIGNPLNVCEVMTEQLEAIGLTGGNRLTAPDVEAGGQHAGVEYLAVALDFGKLIEKINQQGASVTPPAVDDEARVMLARAQQALDIDPDLFTHVSPQRSTSVGHGVGAYPRPPAIAAEPGPAREAPT